MECQNTIKNLMFNINKSIGEVIVVIEGESEEFKLLKHIFVDVFDYNYIPLKRKKGITDIMKSKTNKKFISYNSKYIKFQYEINIYR